MPIILSSDYKCLEIDEASLPPRIIDCQKLSTKELYSLRDELKTFISRNEPDDRFIKRIVRGKMFYFRRKYTAKTNKPIEKAIEPIEWRNGRVMTYRTKIYKSLLTEISREIKARESKRNRISKSMYMTEKIYRRNQIKEISKAMSEVVAGSCNSAYAERLELVTARGEKVRSKSEIIIANALYAHGVPYYYERPLTLSSGRIVYPDFTIIDTIHGFPMYWEHFGMLNNDDYLRAARDKLIEYEQDGIFVNLNLVITYDGVGDSTLLDAHEVNRKIEWLFAA